MLFRSLVTSNELGIMSYYGLVTGALFNVTSLYKKRGMAVIMVHQQKLLVRLADLSCLSFVQES